MIFAIWMKVRRHLQKRRLIRDLEDQSAAATPFHQFSQALRLIQRKSAFLGSAEEGGTPEKIEFLNSLERAYRIYIGRAFLVPTLAWKNEVVLKDLKSNHKKTFENYGKQIVQLFDEFSQARLHPDKLKNKDLHQIFDLARKNVDALRMDLERGDS
jgi:hypothetical protein